MWDYFYGGVFLAIQNVLTQTVALFLLIIIGYIVKKLDVVRDSDVKGISELIVKVTMPIMIVVSMSREFSREKLVFSAIMFGVSSLSYIFKNIIAKWFTKVFKVEGPESAIYEMMILFSNSGFMGFPVVKALYGEEGVFYAAIINVSFNIFIWTLGVNIISRHNGKRAKPSVKSLLKNPGIASVLIGAVLFIAPVEIPEVLKGPLQMIGESTTPLAMMTIGMLLVNTSVKTLFRNKKLALASMMRILVFPIAFMALLFLLKIPPMLTGILLILESMPAASSIAIFARRYDSDYELASQGVFLSTLLNVITIPFILYLFSMLFKV